jgi:YHS domain-containing protein
MTAAQIVSDYLAAYTSGDIERAASLVSEDFAFRGPIQTTVGRAALKRMAAHVAPNARGCRIIRQWQDGEDVCSLYEFNVDTGGGPTSVLISEWDTVRDGQIASSTIVFDTGPFRPAGQRSTADVDPVCGMTVDPATAPAHRRHADHDLYFCSEVCAEAFDSEAGRYQADLAQA